MKKLGTLILGAILTLGIGAGISFKPNTDVAHAVDTPVSIDLSAQNYANQQEISTVKIDDYVSLKFDKGTNSNTPKYYTSGTSVRVYGGGTLTVQGYSCNIKSIGFTFGSGDKTNEITADVGTYDSGNWAGSAEKVVFTIGGTSGHRRFQEVSVTYELGDVDTSKVSSFEITETNVLLGISETFTPTYSVSPETATDKSVTWESSEPTVATVDNNGKVTALSQGVTTITGTTNDGQKTDSYIVAVVTHKGTESDPLTVTDAVLLGENGFNSNKYYISGTIKEISISTTANGVLTDGVKDIELYKVYDTGNNVNFTDTNKVKVSDKVVIYSAIGVYNEKPQINYGWFVSIESVIELVSITISGSLTGEQYIGEEWNLSGLTVTANYSDSSTSDVTSAAEWVINPSAPTTLGEQEISITANYNGASTTKTFTVNVLKEIVKIVDVITYSTLNHTETSGYQSTTFTATSKANYSANSYPNNENKIQLRTDKNNSGIVSTSLAGKRIYSVEIDFHESSTNSSRWIQIYGSNSAYTGEGASALYGDAKGTLIGEYKITTTEKIIVSGDYKYIGLRSNSGAIYLDSVTIEWEAYTADTVAAEIKTLAGGWDNEVTTENCYNNYAAANELVLVLSETELNEFKTSTDTEIANARTTYEHWCFVNGAEAYEETVPAGSRISAFNNSNNMIIIVVAISSLVILAAAGLLISRKRRYSK